MNPTELRAQRQSTKAFIAADPLQIALFRPTKTRNASGGQSRSEPEEPLAPQTLRLLPASDRMPEVRLTGGELVSPTHTLMGEWDADLQRDDYFYLNEVQFVCVSPPRPEHSTESVYQRKIDVVRRG